MEPQVRGLSMFLKSFINLKYVLGRKTNFMPQTFGLLCCLYKLSITSSIHRLKCLLKRTPVSHAYVRLVLLHECLTQFLFVNITF